MTDEVKIFIQRSRRLDLFLQSVEQGIAVYRGQNLVVYAGRLDFALERKLRRVDERAAGRSRQIDISDAVALVHHLRGDGHPLSWHLVQKLDENRLGMKIGNEGIRATASAYMRLHRTQGIVEMQWDITSKRWKYVDLKGEWIWI